jgi:hypothetical protein
MPAWSNPQTVGTVAGEPIVDDLGEGPWPRRAGHGPVDQGLCDPPSARLSVP